MNFSGFLSKSLALVCVLCMQQFAQAELVIFRIQAIQDLVLLPGTPFNDTGADVPLPDVSATGIMQFDSLTQVGTTIELVNGTFLGSGDDIRLGGSLALTAGAGRFTPMSGLLEDVVRDPNHPGFATGALASILSANMSFIVPDYGVVLANGVELEVRDPFLFRAQLDGVPTSIGTEFLADPLTGIASRLDVYIAGTDTIIGYSTNRRLFVVVPEPSSLGIIGLAVSGIGVLLRRRRV